MTDYRAVLKQALWALESSPDGAMWSVRCEEAITAIRAALAQQEQDWSMLAATAESLREHQLEVQRLRGELAEKPQQEPVAIALYEPVYKQLRINPVVSMTVTPTTAWQGEIPLYLHPPKREESVCPYIRSTAEGTHHCSLAAEPPRRKPLTDEEVLWLWSGDVERPVLGKNKVLSLARAVERAHGIGEE